MGSSEYNKVLDPWCQFRGVKSVPVIHWGPIDSEGLDRMRQGSSTLLDGKGKTTQPVREGIVIKPLVDETCYMDAGCSNTSATNTC